ncbi:MAG: beta-propeller fold lactonase family protein [Deltaproteobacteria bacterium]|nr:beta-propeller fold lactonase family protein [Deltaproteobacteria bacterium]
MSETSVPNDVVNDMTVVTEAGAEASVETEAGAEAGTPDDASDAADTGAPRVARTLPTRGTGVALTSNDSHAVAVNRTANSVAIFRTSFEAMPPTTTRTSLLATGNGSEPSSVVIGNDDDTAYVALRGSQQVIKITSIRTTATIATSRATVGSEPTDLAISPTGQTLYVANYQDGTISVVNTADMTVTRTVDLNAALANSGLLGPSVMGNSRPALAHPRALVVTNNGDTNDADETVYVTEFYSQARTSGVPADDSQFDLNRQGVVYQFNAGTGTVGSLITLAPVTDTGFQDSNAATTGCFTNQLFSLALNANRLYVTSVCESPRGPTGPVGTDVRNFQTEIHAVISVINTMTNLEDPAQRVLLNQRLQQQYTTRTTADDGTRRFPLIMNDIQFVAGTNVAYVSAYGSDAVFRVRFNADGTFNEVGTTTSNFVNLASLAGADAGRLPVGIALASSAAHVANRALVINENTRNLSVLDLSTQSAVSAAASATAPTAGAETDVNLGRRFFVTGLGRWSLRGQGWNSCESCHPDGLSDNVTWFFARGPRQTTSLDATFNRAGTEQRVMNWTGIFDEVHDFELNTRGNSGGVGAVVHRIGAPVGAEDRIVFDGAALTGAQVGTATSQAGLNGSVRAIRPGVPGRTAGTTATNVLADWDEIDEYVKTIRPPRRPSNLDAADVTAGRALFESNNCGGCHGGPLWTTARRFWTPNETNNAAAGLLRMQTYMGFAGGNSVLNPASAMAPAALRFSNADSAIVAANDQINCVLRHVGTIGPVGADTRPAAIVPPGVVVKEARANMTTAAQGLSGFAPPGLVGMGMGAPYFHAGNARTLEELLSTVFQSHYQAFSANFLTNSGAARANDVRRMVAFLLSIDDDTMVVPVRGSLAFDPQLCPANL